MPLWLAHIFDVVAAFVLCLYFMLEGEYAYYYFLSFFEPESRERLNNTLMAAEHRMSKWLLGQGSLMLIPGRHQHHRLLAGWGCDMPSCWVS